MDLSYFDHEHYVSAHLMELGHERFLLTELQTNRHFGQRGQGHAGRLLARVLEDADHEGVTLCLSLDPDGSEGALARDALRSFYERRGFVLIEEGAMARLPQGLAAEPSSLRELVLR
jgi:GNAT superfamily N-acetyltransferase